MYQRFTKEAADSDSNGDEGHSPRIPATSFGRPCWRKLSFRLVVQPSKSAAHRDKSRERNVSKKTFHLCQLKSEWTRNPAQQVQIPLHLQPLLNLHANIPQHF